MMVLILITTTTILMFLAFGSVVLPIKAAVMSALTLGSTMGVLTWMFVDGHGAGLMNYTPQPLMAPMIGLIIAVIWGLSTDYEVFLVSRMVEARERGMSTAEAIRIGTATTGRLITGAALVLAVVAGAFVFSDLVMMKYLAFGLLIALLLDATIVRMFLVPAIMKLLGDDCWWAPRWMKRIQERLGLGETELPDERKRPAVREPAENPEALVGAGAPVPSARPRAPHDPTHPAAEGASRPGAAARAAAPPRTNAPSSTGNDAYAESGARRPTNRRRRGCHRQERGAQRRHQCRGCHACGRRPAGSASARGAGDRVVARRIARHRRTCGSAGHAVADQKAVHRTHPGDARGVGRDAAQGRPQPPSPGNEPTKAMPAQKPRCRPPTPPRRSRANGHKIRTLRRRSSTLETRSRSGEAAE